MENAIKMGIDKLEAFATEINTYFDSRYLTHLEIIIMKPIHLMYGVSY